MIDWTKNLIISDLVPENEIWIGYMNKPAGVVKIIMEEEKVNQPDYVNHPPHYNVHPSGVECIDIVEHFSFNIGNAIKYLWRAGLKSKNPIEDFKKAIWYIEREIKKLEALKTKGE